MDFPYQSAFAEALGWSLIDSLWQMGAAWLLYILITGNGRKFTSQQRHMLALIGSTAGMLLFIFSIAHNYHSTANNSNFFGIAYLIENQTGEFFGDTFSSQIVPFLSVLYLPTVAIFFLRLLLHITTNKNIYGKNLFEADDSIIAFVNDMCERSGILKKVNVWISEKVESPLTLGFWKPVIFLPVAVFSHLSCKQVEAVIMHELHHIRRNDYLINIFLTIAEVVFFFNPFARLMFSAVKKERENSCDDHVLAAGFDAWEYSEALYILGRYRNEKNSLAIAATGEGKEYLLQRIRRIMNRTNPTPSVLKPFVAFFLCLFVAGFAVRQKQVAGIPEASIESKIDPAVYYEKQIISITNPEQKASSTEIVHIKRSPAKDRKNSTPSFKKNDHEATLISRDVIVTREPKTDESNDLISRYVVAPEIIEFTIIDPVLPSVPAIVCETPQPYIQKSSFYFTEIDTTAGRKVIVL